MEATSMLTSPVPVEGSENTSVLNNWEKGQLVKTFINLYRHIIGRCAQNCKVHVLRSRLEDEHRLPSTSYKHEGFQKVSEETFWAGRLRKTVSRTA